MPNVGVGIRHQMFCAFKAAGTYEVHEREIFFYLKIRACIFTAFIVVMISVYQHDPTRHTIPNDEDFMDRIFWVDVISPGGHSGKEEHSVRWTLSSCVTLGKYSFLHVYNAFQKIEALHAVTTYQLGGIKA
ncbi:uncharacterized protein PHALS_01819 [Plasmopara halstedii]|uniref:Uncharacterized protein n=1 Tax=Plasmopara halstedii TaxID=4781 RepID=A0A0P1AVR6_PLAHL|nr:uncharacterized protein PHALS_01819 [Plasmopara halstedii]CEG45529.1 hypothetical protein PHALS_01819 [Plasmopara halstedii]|eukprot:XP_024581898.1 hypothetical protein PHALS_01819 [Plasmopara halstedii]